MATTIESRPEVRPNLIQGSAEALSEGFSWFKQRISEWREILGKIAQPVITLAIGTGALLGSVYIAALMPEELKLIATVAFIGGMFVLATKDQEVRPGGGWK